MAPRLAPISEGCFAGNGSSSPWGFTLLGNGKVLFKADSNGAGVELWATNGTEAGTVMVSDIKVGSNSSSPSALMTLGNGKAVFAAQSAGTAWEMWVSNGTAAGTQALGTVSPVLQDAFGASPFVKLGLDRVLFRGADAASGTEWWVTDGTANGTQLLKDVAPGAANGVASNNSSMVILDNGKVVFVASNATAGAELSRSRTVRHRALCCSKTLLPVLQAQSTQTRI